jgi:cytochrome c oxidase assembly protein subunit 15
MHDFRIKNYLFDRFQELNLLSNDECAGHNRAYVSTLIHDDNKKQPLKDDKYIANWLLICCILVILMILIGGFTRLTNSGLSIVEWKPVTGIIPPLTEEDWQIELTKYRNTPEYQQLGANIDLAEFKFIFIVEFIHRLAGRITGLMYLIPLLYFFIRNKLRTEDRLPHFFILTLFFIQGFMGWYMVKSGLQSVPYISHFRLAFHLIIAVLLYSLIFWQLMKNNFDIVLVSRQENFNSRKNLCLLLMIMLYGQIFLGGLVAGLDAGLVYNSFPLMGGSFVPHEISLKTASLTDPVFVQFIHRIGAYLLSIAISTLIFILFRINNYKLHKVACYIAFALLLQMLAGIATVIYSVPIFIALVHQIGAIILLSCLLWCYFLLKNI